MLFFLLTASTRLFKKNYISHNSNFQQRKILGVEAFYIFLFLIVLNIWGKENKWKKGEINEKNFENKLEKRENTCGNKWGRESCCENFLFKKIEENKK
ncbi:hypothetical protein RFI_21027 [Reticulomyxa filosa]|uniref:Uncharacterized protein n=1 Tax=Reticulomyxa filosa TaxID=46433 RepID=X6MT95_RETFI|nr:hypothetical protein RFI_21027 [Reticulomyxa filosa]|eukprot:ETO16325.1 hypothetical protein RFI_21027 [Reticulomyxa filosa]